MIASILVQDRVNGNITDISNIVFSLEWETTLQEQAGKLTARCLDDKKTYFVEGSRITVTIGSVGLFIGFVFKRERSEGTVITLTAYDQMRYLQNKDIVNMPIMTSSEVFTKICKEQELTYKVVHPSSYKCPVRVHDNKTYYEMIESALDDTIRNTSEWFFIRDNFGILEHVEVEKLFKELNVSLVIGDASLLTGYTFVSSIDDDTYNEIKLTRDNKETVKRDVYIVKDSENIGRWGKLQYYESMSEDANEAQIKAKAENLLTLKNRPTRSLNVQCLGDIRIRAGNGLTLDISELANENIEQNNQSAIVYTCTHKFENDAHTMSLELEII